MNAFQIGILLILGIMSGAVLTSISIPILQRRHTGQNVREEGPKSHQVKAGTPTMGGIAIIAATILSVVVTKNVHEDFKIITVAFLLFGLMGFLDDALKVKHKQNLGLRAWQKLVLQIILGIAIGIYMMQTSDWGSHVWIPFTDMTVDFGVLYVPFIAFVVVAMANAVNLTDGLDGLAAGVTAIVALFFAFVGSTYGSVYPTAYSAAVAGACLGFLIFNRNPAKVFMGDTGSLALGGCVAVIAITMHVELLLVLAGLVYVLEALSVLLQVGYFKLTHGKRIFKMAPLHHHFEMCGMKEKYVVAMFWAATIVFCAVGLCAL